MTTIISDAGVQFAGGNIVDVRSTVPISGNYTAGDFILESTTTAKVTGWKRLTTGSGHVLNTDWAYVGGLTLGTAVATTSGTSVAITGIPSWAKRITLQLLGVSTNGGSQLMVQLGDSGGVETTGYLGGAATSSSGVTSTASDSAGFILEAGGAFTAASIRYGHIVLTLSDASNTWSMSSVTALTAGNVVSQAAGGKQTSAALDRISLTTVSGTDTFDAGSFNILYE